MLIYTQIHTAFMQGSCMCLSGHRLARDILSLLKYRCISGKEIRIFDLGLQKRIIYW